MLPTPVQESAAKLAGVRPAVLTARALWTEREKQAVAKSDHKVGTGHAWNALRRVRAELREAPSSGTTVAVDIRRRLVTESSEQLVLGALADLL